MKNQSINPIIKRAIVGGVVSTIIMGIGTFIIGETSGYEARDLLITSSSGINILCNTVILGSSTILALMLTLLSLSRATKSHLTEQHYHNVLTIAKSDTVLIITAVITFLMLNLPITQSNEVPGNWYTYIYYITQGMAAILGGGFIAVITMLYGTIKSVILIVGFSLEDHPLVDKEDVDQAKEEEKQDKEEKEESKKREEEAEKN